MRVETERRLKALQADLAQAQQSRVEKTMAVRYHKVRGQEQESATYIECYLIRLNSLVCFPFENKICLWFIIYPRLERQKAVRRIRKTSRELQDPSLDKKTKRKLEKTLFEQRIDLNYVLVSLSLSLLSMIFVLKPLL